MVRLAIVFLVLAVIAAIFGFFVVVGALADIIRVLALIFLVLFVVSLITGRRRV
jgi:uncharacterized membrane protein YtjA (UPF0391 family)